MSLLHREDDEAVDGPYAELGRLFAVTDGVFAIAITLLVLGLAGRGCCGRARPGR